MTPTPLFSIITACRNDLPRLKETASSLLSQTCSDWEWVVFDSASGDGTADWLATNPVPGLAWVSERDRGIYDAFNKGGRKARGKYLIWLCAGDCFNAPDVLARAKAHIEAAPGHHLYYGDTKVIYPDGTSHLRLARHHSWIWWSEFTHHQSIFYDRSCFDLATYREEHRIGGDYTFNAELLLKKAATASQIPGLTIADFPVGGTSYKHFWEGEWDNWACRRDILGMGWPKRAGILAAHAGIRVTRVALPGVYRLLRYAKKPGGPALPAAPASPRPLCKEGVAETPTAGVPQSPVTTARLIGLDIRSGRPEDCVAMIDAATEQATVKLGYVNTYTAYLASRNAEARNALAGFVLLNDGLGLDIVSLVTRGRRFANNLNGTDFTPYYLQKTRQTYRVFLLGARPGVAEKAEEALATIAPQHAYVGCQHGYFAASEAPHVLARIRASGADLVVVAFGNPAQERWIAEHAGALGLKCAIGAGALLDFLSGTVPRAPAWMRRVRLEWLYRLGLEPARMWRRYIVYTPAIILAAIAERFGRKAEPA